MSKRTLCVSLLAASSFVTLSVQADTIVQWNFNDQTSNPSLLAAGFSGSTWSRESGGNINFANEDTPDGQFAIKGEANGPGGKNWNPDSWLFSISNTSANPATLDSFSFLERSQNNGPTSWSLSAYSDAARTTPLFTGATLSLENDNDWFTKSGTFDIPLNAGATVYFALTGDGAKAGNPWAIDLFTLTGSGGGIPSEVPLPSAVWLLGSALAGLTSLGRRRSSAI